MSGGIGRKSNVKKGWKCFKNKLEKKFKQT